MSITRDWYERFENETVIPALAGLIPTKLNEADVRNLFLTHVAAIKDHYKKPGRASEIEGFLLGFNVINSAFVVLLNQGLGSAIFSNGFKQFKAEMQRGLDLLPIKIDLLDLDNLFPPISSFAERSLFVLLKRYLSFLSDKEISFSSKIVNKMFARFSIQTHMASYLPLLDQRIKKFEAFHVLYHPINEEKKTVKTISNTNEVVVSIGILKERSHPFWRPRLDVTAPSIQLEIKVNATCTPKK